MEAYVARHCSDCSFQIPAPFTLMIGLDGGEHLLHMMSVI